MITLFAAAGCGSQPSPAEARKQLIANSVEVTLEQFVRSSAAGDVEAVRLFLAAEYDPNKSNGRPLEAAVDSGHTEVAQALLEAGADPNIVKVNTQETAREGNLGLLRLLQESGYDFGGESEVAGLFRAVAETGQDSLSRDQVYELMSFASETGGDPCYRFAEGEAKLNYMEETFTSLHAAAETGNVHAAEYLLEAGCQPNARRLYSTMIMHAAERVSSRQLRGIRTETLDFVGPPPLYDAAQGEHHEVVSVLIEAGADPDMKGVTPDLIYELKRSRSPEEGYIPVIARDGPTALHAAAATSSTAVVKALLEGGADPNYAGPRTDPVVVAQREGHGEVARLIREARQ